MLYSPLYQSIRLILFGALGFSSLSVSAAINDADTQSTEPSMSSASSYASDDSDVDSELSITAINEADDTSSLQPMDVVDSDSKSNDTQVSTTITPDSTATNSQQLNTSDESVQASLMRLAEFYELTPETDTSALNNVDEVTIVESEDTQSTLAPAAQTIPKVGKDLRLLPSAVDSAQRCEGQWVYPKSNPNYQRAVNEAGAANGQPIAEVDSVPNNQAPLFTESDYGYYNNINYAELSGNVKVDQGTQHIEAEKVVIDLSNGVAAAQGKVMFTDQATGKSVKSTPNRSQASLNDRARQGGLIGVADSLNYNTETGQSTANDVAFASVELQAHGYAKRLNKPNDSEYELDEVMFSTCPPTNRKWQFDAKSIDLNTDTGRGEAYDTTFRIADVPVFYLPYFNFPIDSRRSSGFLLPSASVSSESGVELDVPYYFNLAPNYDATLNTQIYTNRNPMLSGEFRYLTENYGEGIVSGSYLPNDKEFNDEDHKISFYDLHH